MKVPSGQRLRGHSSSLSETNCYHRPSLSRAFFKLKYLYVVLVCQCSILNLLWKIPGSPLKPGIIEYDRNPSTQRLRPEDEEFQANQNYIMRPYLKQTNEHYQESSCPLHLSWSITSMLLPFCSFISYFPYRHHHISLLNHWTFIYKDKDVFPITQWNRWSHSRNTTLTHKFCPSLWSL